MNLTPWQEKLVFASLFCALLALVANIIASYQNEQVVYGAIAIIIAVPGAWFANGGFYFLATKPGYGLGLIVASGISILLLTVPFAPISAIPFGIWFAACYWA
jgi:hypothetical protein